MENPLKNIFDILPNYQASIGVMGSASGEIMRNPKTVAAAQEIGRQIAKHGYVLSNGACPGLPNEAAKGAKEAGGKTCGISPAISICSHLKQYKSPIDHYDTFIFTGLGLMMRDIINIRSVNAVVILPGGTGTLNEFTVAYDEGKPIGILTGFGGVAHHIEEILGYCNRGITDRMVFDADPEKLIDKLVKVMKASPVSCMIDDYLLGDTGVITQIEKEFMETVI